MAERSLIADDLLREIIAAGQVDLLVGVRTRDHEQTIADVVRAVRACFRTYFPRRRTALMAVDLGSSDGTTQAVAAAWAGGLSPSGSAGLRTTHCITTVLPVVSDSGGPTQTILAAADLLQATAVVVLDADLRDTTPDLIAAFAGPVGDSDVDLVAPVYRRQPAEGLLVTQLVRPLVQMAFGHRLREPLLPEFGCSGRLAAHCTQVSAATGHAARETHVWIAAEALAGTFQVRQTELGPRAAAEIRRQPSLPALFPHVVTPTFSAIDAHARWWRARADLDEVPVLRPWRGDDAPADVRQDGTKLLQHFQQDLADLREVLRRILDADTIAALTTAASHPDGPSYADELWAVTLIEFLTAFHHAVMRRDHVVQALLPLYVARTGAFLQARGHGGPNDVDAAADDLAACLLQVKPRLLERWDRQQEVGHG